MQDENIRAFKPPVIVRAWGDEPVKLILYRIENKRCYVGSENSTAPIGLPIDQVFVFVVDEFKALSTAFQQGDARKLGELWAKHGVDDFACNRYQDNLDYRHD